MIDTRLQTPTVIADQFQRELARAHAEKGVPPPEGPGQGEKGEKAADTGTPKPSWEAQMDRIRDALSNQPAAKPSKKSTAEPAPARDSAAPKPGAGDTRNVKPGGPDKPDKGSTESLAQRVKRLSDPSLSKLDPETVKAMQRTRPLVPHLTSQARVDNAGYTAHMAAGERLLAEGRFFDAEERFAKALDAAPGDTLAQVGQVHARLSAGLYLSAAYELRSLFASHPEMVGAKYGADLCPNAERAAIIAKFLREALPDDQGGLGRDAALLMAYLGYQRSDKKLVEEGLTALASKTDPDDPGQTTLLGLLHRVWVEGDDLPAPPAPAK
jgi:hypothetical protein